MPFPPSQGSHCAYTWGYRLIHSSNTHPPILRARFPPQSRARLPATLASRFLPFLAVFYDFLDATSQFIASSRQPHNDMHRPAERSRARLIHLCRLQLMSPSYSIPYASSHAARPSPRAVSSLFTTDVVSASTTPSHPLRRLHADLPFRTRHHPPPPPRSQTPGLHVRLL
ncbi:hypothetical protein FB45DRAFT_945484 [Roridomyces roridus]|uniref:Uncharacterized protein n=1 Tax=Roridomyces roridus TaxID=1738132 RepID=A0AAD7F8P9_9AGAR|nr:hypothetical protein FB45DRAFT_945484 [Roridomyces roridus]